MIDYQKYTDIGLKKKPLTDMDDLERQYIDREVDREAGNIFAKLINRYGSEYTCG